MLQTVYYILKQIAYKFPLLDWYKQIQSVRDVADYLEISRFEALRKARIKKSLEGESLWNEYERRTKDDYHDFYAKTVRYTVRQDWYNRNNDLSFLKLIPPFGNLLDYGCGTAYVAFKAKQKRPDIEILLADLPEAMTKKFAIWRLQRYNLEFKWFDIPKDEKVNFSDAKFDFIRCHDVFEHTFHPDVVINNFFKSLKHGGFLSFDFLEDPTCHRENTREAQELRDNVMEFVEKHFKLIRRIGGYNLVQKR